MYKPEIQDEKQTLITQQGEPAHEQPISMP